jgi:site-specific DNA recombinase
VIYARFSSDKQEERSIDDQVALCRDYARRTGLTIVDEPFADYAMSGSSVHGRFAFQRMVEDAKRGRFDVILTEDLDRLSRNQADQAGLYERLTFLGVGMVTVADGAINEMHIGLKGTMSALFLKTLAAKTHRGQAGRVREGKIAGGRSYGYRPVLGKPGELEIVDAEADVVRRIFADTLRGASPRALAAALNREGIPSPKGGNWNGSTIRGSADRATGILRNSLYDGRIVWNRMRFVRDPDTGKRVSRVNDATALMTTDTPALRIVDAATWSAVAELLTERAKPHANGRPMRPRHMLSGLMRCGVCGASYIVSGNRGPGPQFACSGRREKGVCDNARTIAGAKVEARILAALETHLLAPDAVAEMMRAYVAERGQAEAAGRRERQRSEKRLGAVRASSTAWSTRSRKAPR